MSFGIVTRGTSGLMFVRHWRMMGALEAADGMLLFGISMAFIFAIDASVPVDGLLTTRDHIAAGIAASSSKELRA